MQQLNGGLVQREYSDSQGLIFIVTRSLGIGSLPECIHFQGFTKMIFHNLGFIKQFENVFVAKYGNIKIYDYIMNDNITIKIYVKKHIFKHFP